MDNFYRPVDIYGDLEIKMVGCSGTIWKNRKGLPSEIKTTKLICADSLYFQSGNLIAMKWKTEKMCWCSQIAIMDKVLTIKIIGPYPIVQWNINTGGVDLANQYTTYYAHEHRTTNIGSEYSQEIMDMGLYNGNVINCPLKKRFSWI